MDLLVTVHHAADLSTEQVARIATLQAGIDYGLANYVWAAESWHAVAYLDGDVAGHAGILCRDVGVASRSVTVAGLCNVWTLEALRFRGVGEAVVRAAMDWMRERLAVDFGLLLCRSALRPYYEGLGWQVVMAPLSCEQPDGIIAWPHVTMVMPFSSVPWPPGPIDLRGLPW